MSTALDRLLEHLSEAKKSKTDDKWRAKCPSHDGTSPNSLSLVQIEGMALVHCFGGCKTTDVMAALGLTEADLYDEPKGARYDYTDPFGTVLRSVHRTPSKAFRQSGATSDAPVLYRLPAVQKAVEAGVPVHVVEGEKDVHALESLGAVATTSPMGAANWPKVDASPLTGAHVVVIPDNDKAGEGYLRDVLASLEGVAASVTVKRAKVGKDAADHVAAGHGLDELVQDVAPPVVAARHLVVTRASEIAVRPVHWLWADRLPLGSLALLAGREGIGKSTVGYQLAADLTRGSLPGRYLGQPKSVVIAATEDSWEHTIVPRLMAAGADLHRVLRVDVVTHDGASASLTLPRDTSALGRLIEAEDVALVLLDPLMSRLDGALDSHKDAEVRVALEPITAIADRTGAAVLGIIHVNKGKGADALDRIMGSRAFSAVARSVLFVLKDPDDENLRTLGTPKNNLGRTDNLPTLRFGIVGTKVADTDEGEVWTGRIDWLGEDTRSIDELLQSSEDTSDNRSATGEAADWLVDYLTQQGGEAESSDAKKSGLKAGHSVDALKRARKQAKVSTRSHGFPRTTVWFLPELVAQSEQPSEGSRGETHLTALTAPTGAQSVQSVQSVQSEDVSRSRPDCVGIAACAICGQPGEHYRGHAYAYCLDCRTTSTGVAS